MNAQPGKRRLRPASRMRLVKAARAPEKLTREMRKYLDEAGWIIPNRISSVERRKWYEFKTRDVMRKIQLEDRINEAKKAELDKLARRASKIDSFWVNTARPLYRWIIQTELKLHRMEILKMFLLAHQTIEERNPPLPPQAAKEMWRHTEREIRSYQQQEKKQIRILENDELMEDHLRAYAIAVRRGKA